MGAGAWEEATMRPFRLSSTCRLRSRPTLTRMLADPGEKQADVTGPCTRQQQMPCEKAGAWPRVTCLSLSIGVDHVCRTCPMCSFKLTNPEIAPKCWDAFDPDDESSGLEKQFPHSLDINAPDQICEMFEGTGKGSPHGALRRNPAGRWSRCPRRGGSHPRSRP